MATARAPKQWCLTKTETVNSFESWRQNLQYTLSLDPNFAHYLVEGTTWLKKTRAAPLRGLQDDADTVPAARRLTAQQKVAMLELMLGQIANYCPVISRNTIVKTSTSIESIWQAIRMHYGFQSTGAHFIDFADVKLEPGERPEDLYQRLVAFMEDNLLKRDGGITHHGDIPEEDEEASPSLENLVTLTWLQLLHKDLPRLVKQRYGTELRCRTLSSIKPEISQAMDSLLDEVTSAENVRVMRTASGHLRTNYQHRSHKPTQQQKRVAKICPLCKQAGRAEFQHYLSTCRHLPETDRKFMTKARQTVALDEDQYELCTDSSYVNSESQPDEQENESTSRRVQVKQSPYFNVFYQHHAIQVTIDSGATTNMIKASAAKHVGAKITKSSQVALQADGLSPLIVVGETRMTLSRDNKEFDLNALVIENLSEDILAGVPFMALNDITIRPAKHQVILSDGTIYQYGNKTAGKSSPAVRRTQAYVLRAPSSKTTIWPGDYIEVDIPSEMTDEMLALEPRTDATNTFAVKTSQLWPPPSILATVGNKVRIPNTTEEPKVLSRNEHFCQVRAVFSPPVPDTASPVPYQPHIRSATSALFSSTVKLDPDGILPATTKSQFQSLHAELDDVFDPQFNGYNGALGHFEAVVNMGPIQPPQRKGRVPQYARGKLVELQQKFDELENIGVFQRPEDVNVVAEYINPSFLVKKPSGGFRLVTAFAEVGRYSKPQPSLMPDVDSTLRTIACWKHIIVSDLTSAFYQIPLSKESMKYCGVVTPFRGVRVYTRSAMGMPGSETALEELMSRILGDLLQDGIVAKLADDLYCGGNSLDELLCNWRKVLQAFHKCNIRLAASKTIVCPKTTTILGWVWTQGSIHASSHRIATLSMCPPPETVSGLRSFIGAYKFLARVLPNCSHNLAPLVDAVAGRASQEKLTWTEELHSAFNNAQQALASNKTIVLPRPEDHLWIVTDGAVKKHGIGATLYVVRDSKPRLAGFFSAKLRKRQMTWLPCEIEALSIATAIRHFSPYIIQSKHNTSVLTDSRPCVQAFEKLCRGEFSASPRLSTFLTVVSQYQATIRHLAGSANIPSDFASRNAAECNNPDCQICSFIVQTEDCVVRNVSIQDIISEKIRLPFTSRAAWSSTQQECPELRRVHAHLRQGTRPSKKDTHIRDVKRYLNVASIAKDGLLIVRQQQALAPPRERIIIPRQVLDGLILALHIKLDHPTCHQLKIVVHRYFFALDMDKSIEAVSKTCHVCASLQKIPHTIVKQDTCDPPDALGVSFSADVIRRDRQMIFVLRENVTSFTAACLIENERCDALRTALIQLCIELRPLDGPTAVVRTDPAPGFIALVNDDLLQHHRICIELGRTKNQNKNPVAEKAVQEVEQELLRQDSAVSTGLLTPLRLSIAIARLNSRVRGRGLSAREMWTQRDQFTNEQLPVIDRNIILDQYEQRMQNHPCSEKAKAPQGKVAHQPSVEVGDLVYLYSDGNKCRARDRYLVVSTEGNWCSIRKFTGAQLRNTSYRVKLSECYKVPLDPLFLTYKQTTSESDHEEDDVPAAPAPPYLEPIPQELSQPAQTDIPICQYGDDGMLSTHAGEVQKLPEPPTNSPLRADTDVNHDDTAIDNTLDVHEESNLLIRPEATLDTNTDKALRRSTRIKRPPIRFGYE